jgi:hypothetical protein
VSHLDRHDGFVYQWYDTANGHELTNPGQGNCAAPRARRCSTTASSYPTSTTAGTPRGPIVVRESHAGLRHLADGLIAPMNFGIV